MEVNSSPHNPDNVRTGKCKKNDTDHHTGEYTKKLFIIHDRSGHSMEGWKVLTNFVEKYSAQ